MFMYILTSTISNSVNFLGPSLPPTASFMSTSKDVGSSFSLSDFVDFMTYYHSRKHEVYPDSKDVGSSFSTSDSRKHEAYPDSKDVGSSFSPSDSRKHEAYPDSKDVGSSFSPSDSRKHEAYPDSKDVGSSFSPSDSRKHEAYPDSKDVGSSFSPSDSRKHEVYPDSKDVGSSFSLSDFVDFMTYYHSRKHEVYPDSKDVGSSFSTSDSRKHEAYPDSKDVGSSFSPSDSRKHEVYPDSKDVGSSFSQSDFVDFMTYYHSRKHETRAPLVETRAPLVTDLETSSPDHVVGSEEDYSGREKLHPDQAIHFLQTMRGLQLSLNKGQKLRLESALEQLDSFTSKANSDTAVVVADEVSVNNEDAILKGHGISEIDDRLHATVCGVVERVNKLVYVRALRARYKPDVGDIIIGRVIEVAPKRWRLEINATQDAVLMLSSMNLPDGLQRRKTSVDELNMRSIFEENDVICAEVHGVQHGSLHLQTRSQKYGKLKRGQLLTIPPYLVKKRKQHFHHLDQYGIDLILGCNGFIWVGEHVEVRDDMAEDLPEQQIVKPWNTEGDQESEDTYTPLDIRQNICKAANAIRVCSTLGFMITAELVTVIVDLSVSLNIDVHEMLSAEFYVLVAEKEAERRSLSTKRR